eukprot:3938976-Rhodomonas_salina.2
MARPELLIAAHCTCASSAAVPASSEHGSKCGRLPDAVLANPSTVEPLLPCCTAPTQLPSPSSPRAAAAALAAAFAAAASAAAGVLAVAASDTAAQSAASAAADAAAAAVWVCTDFAVTSALQSRPHCTSFRLSKAWMHDTRVQSRT